MEVVTEGTTADAELVVVNRDGDMIITTVNFDTGSQGSWFGDDSLSRPTIKGKGLV